MSENTYLKQFKPFSLHNLFFLLIFFSIGLIIRFYYLPFDVPLTSDAGFYFWYANDMSILKQLPIEYNAHNNFWSSILSIFFTINPSNDILNYMNLQRSLSVVISALTVFPMFFLCKKFLPNHYALIGSAFFVFDPRIIINSLLGITEPIYLLIGILIILFSLGKKPKLHYLSFGLAAVFSLIRYEGLIILIPLTITYFWKFKINVKSLLKYGFCILVFLLILLPLIELRIQATGEDGLTSHLYSGTKYVSNTFSGDYEKQDSSDFVKDSIFNSITFLGWITIPIWIIFLPYGIWKFFKNLDYQKSCLLFFSIMLILPALYGYGRDIPETRYLYVLFPLFTIFTLYSIERISRDRNYKMIFSIIIIGIIVGSVGWLEYKWIDKEYEKEAFELSLKIKEITGGINDYPPESLYHKFIDTNKEFPKLKNEIYEKHKTISSTNYNNLEDLLIHEEKNGLTHIVADKSQNTKSERAPFIENIFDNENQYKFLTKIYDSKDDGFEYHMKIFEINYQVFENSKN